MDLVDNSFRLPQAKAQMVALPESAPGPLSDTGSLERARLATRAAGVGTWDWDIISDEAFWDDQVKTIFGVPENVTPREAQEWWYRLVCPADQEHCKALRAPVPSGDRSYQHEYRITRANDGAERIIRSAGEIVPDAEGMPVRVTGCVWDVTELHRKDEALRQKTEEIKALFDACNGLLGIGDLEGRVVYLNREWERVLGYSLDQLQGHKFSEFMHPDDRRRTVAEVSQLLQGRPVVDLVNRYRHRDGSYRWVQWRCAARGNRIYGHGADITESRDAEQILRATLERSRFLAELIEEVSQPFAIGYPDGRIHFANRAFGELFGYSQEGIEAVNWLQDLWPSEYRGTVEPALEELRRTRQPLRIVRESRRRDGTPIAVELLVHVMRDQHGEADCFVCFLTDLTERRKAQRALRHSEEQYRQIVENASQGIWMVDAEGSTLFANRRLSEMLGYPVEEILGRSFSDFTDEEGRQYCGPLWEKHRQGIRGEHEFHYVRKDGSQLWADVTIQPIMDDHGRFRGALAMVSDVTERRREEREKRELLEQLHQAQRLESVGRLAGGVAHDFNNLLMVINGYSAMMLKRLREGDPLRSGLIQVHKAGSRAAELVEQLLTFSRKKVLDPKPQNLNSLIQDIRNMLERLLGENTLLAVELSPDLGWVMADEGQLHQVLVNLAINSRDAMPRGGTVTIETSNVEVGGEGMPPPPGLAPGPYVLLTFTDCGSGMDDEVRHRIFEPFFTTKPEGQGTGLGLFTVYGIVRQYSGWISVLSHPGEGTSFRVLLPRTAEPPAAVQEAPRPIPGTLRGAETVLVVEDQEAVRSFAAEALRSYGYNVLEASMGGEALLLAESHPEPIHLMLTDVVMPRMTGMELAARLLPLRPNMRVLYMSAYRDRAVAIDEDNEGDEEGMEFIAKPFSPDTLAAKVRSVLGVPASRSRILVVEEDPGVRELFETVLSGEGYEVFLACDGDRATRLLQQHSFHLVITDVAAKDLDGQELIRLLRAENGDQKILALSSGFKKSSSLSAANATLLRPVHPEQLLTTVAELLA